MAQQAKQPLKSAMIITQLILLQLLNAWLMALPEVRIPVQNIGQIRTVWMQSTFL